MRKDQIVVIDAGLYPDASVIMQALAAPEGAGSVRRLVLPAATDEAKWDELADAVLAAEKTIVL